MPFWRKIFLQNVSSYDYDRAYSTLIDRRNISDETCSIFKACILCKIFDFIEMDSDQFIAFDYKTHITDDDNPSSLNHWASQSKIANTSKLQVSSNERRVMSELSKKSKFSIPVY